MPGRPGSLIGCISHSAYGSLGFGVKYAIVPSLASSRAPFGWVPMTSTFLPVPSRSAYCGVSLQALCQMGCFFQWPDPPMGFSIQ